MLTHLDTLYQHYCASLSCCLVDFTALEWLWFSQVRLDVKFKKKIVFQCKHHLHSVGRVGTNNALDQDPLWIMEIF